MQRRLHILQTHVPRQLLMFSCHVLLLTLAILLVAGCSQREPATMLDVDQTTPEAAVLSWYKAANCNDVQLSRALLDPEDNGSEQALKALEALIASGVSFEIRDIELDIVENDGRMARVRARYHERMKVRDLVVVDEQTGSELTLVNRDGRWYLTGLMQWPPPGWIIE